MNCRNSKFIADFLGIDIENAKKVRGLIKGELDPDTFESVSNWTRQCYHPPSEHEKVFCALNEVIGGHGTEACFDEGKPNLEYINMGDSYKATIVYFDGCFRFTTLGDIIEHKEIL